MQFTRHKFLMLTFLSHLAAVYLCFVGSSLDWIIAICLFVLFTLVSTIFYHRLLSHRSWKPALWLERLGIIIGIFTLTGTPLTRTAVHRAHHKFADTERDPHSPSYSSILLMYLPQLKEYAVDLRLVKDILRDSFLMRIHEYYLLILLVIALILPLHYVLIWGAAASMTWFNIFMCNMFCHRNGIKNNRALGLLTFGEGLHAYHHTYPSDARFGLLDPGYWLIRKLQ